MVIDGWHQALSIKSVSAKKIILGDVDYPVGSVFRIISKHNPTAVIKGILTSSQEGEAELTPLGSFTGVQKSDFIVYESSKPAFKYSDSYLGEVVDPLGMVQGSTIAPDIELPLDPSPIAFSEREEITEVFDTGIKAINSLLTLGVGQRVGLFAGTGVGKSVLMSMIAQYSSADVIVIGLIGERGREVKEFVESTLTPEAKSKSVIIAAPADSYPSMRLQAAKATMSIAEHYRDQGKNVLLLMDSLTRYAQAIREVAFMEGDLPVARGYPARVFYEIPRLVERSGKLRHGSITGIFTVLAEGDDMNDPIVDASRGVLDGHIILSRDLARQGVFPAIDISASVSRLMHVLVDKRHSSQAQKIKTNFGRYEDIKSMELMGSLDKKNNKEAVNVLNSRRPIEELITQDIQQRYNIEESIKLMTEISIK